MQMCISMNYKKIYIYVHKEIKKELKTSIVVPLQVTFGVAELWWKIFLSTW